MLHGIDVTPLDPARLRDLVGPIRAAEFADAAAFAREVLGQRAFVNVNSTATGGGVAELLQTLVGYALGVGVNTQWLVIEGDPGFFEITKRIHHHLYGTAGDGGPLGIEARRRYEATLAPNAEALGAALRGDEVVLLHDPQTAGLVAAAQRTGAKVVWRSHIGCDEPNEHTERGWNFLRPYIEAADAFVFTRAEFAPAWIDRSLLHVITPSIDPFSAKNEQLASTTVRSILERVGALASERSTGPVAFTREDGTVGQIRRPVDTLGTGAPPADAPLIAQLSRWDDQKDMLGVLEGFVEHVDPQFGAHLLLAGPSVAGVTDDPEGGDVLEQCVAAWHALPPTTRAFVHLVTVPMEDRVEAATITNALQQHATIVVQKSLAEGFGLTVVEAMWKHRPVVATRVGGIVDQIDHETNGLLIDDPFDLATFGAALNRLLADSAFAAMLGENAHRRARDEFLGDRHLRRYAQLLADLHG